jgi:hypothetical protein
MSNKITVPEYLKKMAPPLSVLNDIEKYAVQNNIRGNFSFRNDNGTGLFFYTDEEGIQATAIDSKLKRAIFKIYCDRICKEFIVPYSTDKTVTSDDYVIEYFDSNYNPIDKAVESNDVIFYYAICITREGTFHINNPDKLDIGDVMVGVAF